MSVLSTQDLSYYYFSDRMIFENLNMEFERGKVYVILGASGSGKTTLLSLLGGLDTPKGGKVLFEGQDIMSIGLSKYRRNCVSFIFQNYNLVDNMTVFDNVAIALKMVGVKDKKEIDEKVSYVEEYYNGRV